MHLLLHLLHDFEPIYCPHPPVFALELHLVLLVLDFDFVFELLD